VCKVLLFHSFYTNIHYGYLCVRQRLGNRDTKLVFSRGGGGSEGFGYAKCLEHGFSTLGGGWVGLGGSASQVTSGSQRRGSKASLD